MSRWTHVACDPCFRRIKPGVEPIRTTGRKLRACCWCGDTTRDGIFMRADPAKTSCGGNGREHEEEG